MNKPKPFKTKKRLGQHFLSDENIITQIINAINPTEKNQFFEIGPGLGALTIPLLKTLVSINNQNQYYAIELDQDVIGPLSIQAKLTEFKDFVIINKDALKADWNNYLNLDIDINLNKYRCIGNLPYNISTPLILKLIKNSVLFEDITIMVQLEVAERLAAQCDTKDYGRLSVIAQSMCDVEFLFEVPPEAFSPPPKVQSAIVKLTPNPKIKLEKINLLEKITQIAFGQRRKKLSNTLGKYFKDQLSNLDFKNMGIDLNVRAENIGVENYLKLLKYL